MIDGSEHLSRWRRIRTRWYAELARRLPPLARLENQLLEDPAFINVFVRWMAWFMAFLIITYRAAPSANLTDHWLLWVTFAMCALTTVFGSFIRPYLPDGPWMRPLEIPAVTSTVDIVLCCLAIGLTGGWGSPYYEFALTAVIVPSLRYGSRGALSSSILYSVLYVLAVRESRGGHGLDAIGTLGVVDGGFFSAVINPFMVAIFAAYLAEVGQRLQRERLRSQALAAEQERHRLAREIHDGIAQHIYMLTLNLEAVTDLAESEGLAARLRTLLGLSKTALWEVRHYIFDLKPHLAGDKELCASIENTVREFEAITGLPVELHLPDAEESISVATSTALIRIVQEALANIFKHAAAHGITLTVRYQADRVEAEVADDGRGFDPTAPGRHGLGLSSMQQRAAELRGQVTVHSAAGGGTRVVVWLPRQQQEAGR